MYVPASNIFARTAGQDGISYGTDCPDSTFPTATALLFHLVRRLFDLVGNLPFIPLSGFQLPAKAGAAIQSDGVWSDFSRKQVLYGGLR